MDSPCNWGDIKHLPFYKHQVSVANDVSVNTDIHLLHEVQLRLNQLIRMALPSISYYSYSMGTSISYIIQFIHVMVMSCLFNPSNWNQCIRVHQWMPPYMVDLQQFKTNPPYSQEKSAVQLRQEYERVQRNVHADKDRTQLVPSLLQK